MERWQRIWPPALMINWDRFPFLPSKIVMAEQNLRSWSLNIKSTISPDCPLFWIKYLSSLPKFAPRLIGCLVTRGAKPVLGFRLRPSLRLHYTPVFLSSPASFPSLGADPKGALPISDHLSCRMCFPENPACTSIKLILVEAAKPFSKAVGLFYTPPSSQ